MATKPRPHFRVIRLHGHYALTSDSPAAAETGGVVLAGMDLAGVRKAIERLRQKGGQVNAKEIE